MRNTSRQLQAGVSRSHPPIIEEEERFVPSKGWAKMIRKVYEVDPLLCPSCGGQMSIIAIFSVIISLLPIYLFLTTMFLYDIAFKGCQRAGIG